MKRNRFLKLVLICVFCLGFATPVQAGRIFAGVGAGTLGIGADVGYQFSNWLKFRINANYLPVDVDLDFDDVDYNAEFRNLTAGFLVDLHPFMGDFRISVGAYYRDQNIDLSATPKGSIEIGNNSYTAAQVGSLKAEIEWDKFAPYVGLGWGMGSGTDMDFSIDFNLGAMYMSGVKVKYWMTGPAASMGTYQDDIRREAESIKDDIDKWKWYPVVSLFLSFRF